MKITPKIVNANTVFPESSEVYYSYRTTIDPKDYPQVHDFYEIILAVENSMRILLNNDILILNPGDLLFIRPDDVHTKIEISPSVHINLAFPSLTMEALFHYLPKLPSSILQSSPDSHVPIVHLSIIDMNMIQNRLNYLNRLPYTSNDERNTHLRVMLADLMYTYIIPKLKQQSLSQKDTSLPLWLSHALSDLCTPPHLSQGMEYLIQQTGRSNEHICRCFRKYLNITPSAYINEKRLNYSVNLLLHTDMEIIDIIYESGFQSINYYYHLFKKTFGLSPLKYKKMHQRPNL